MNILLGATLVGNIVNNLYSYQRPKWVYIDGQSGISSSLLICFFGIKNRKQEHVMRGKGQGRPME